MQFDDTFQFLLDLVCDETDADVRLDTFLRKMEYRPCLQIALCHTECPFHIPKAVILGNDLFSVKVRVGVSSRSYPWKC